MKKLFFILFSLTSTQILVAQEEAAIREYISRYKEIAIAEMQRTGIPASIKLAQGIHETSAGTSVLVQKSNNHFGLKCKTEWTGMSVKHTDDAPNECFRKYTNSADSYKDQSDYLKNSPRYASLFDLEPTDYKGWATGLKKAGYATNPKYAPVLIKLIEDYNLQDYTLIALGKLKEPAADFAKLEVTPPVEEKKTAPTEINNIITAQEEKKAEELAVKPVYPTGEFKINDTRVVYVTGGVSFLSIAEQYNVPLARIFEFNDMAVREAAEKDQLIFLQRKRKTGNNEFHVVKPGETLHDIAQEEAVRIESLLEYNFLSPGKIPAVGEKLFLRNKATAQPRLALKENLSINLPATDKMSLSENSMVIKTTSVSSSKKVEHKVAPKETIYSIAHRYNVKIDDIVSWNNLQGYDLKTGQQLLIYKL